MEILKNRTPHVANLTITNGEVEALDFGGQAGFVLVQNLSEGDVRVRLNATGNAFTLAGQSAVVFNPGDLYLTSLSFDNTASGGSIAIEVIYGV